MATVPRLARALACPNCLGRLPSARPVAAATPSLPLQLSPAALSITQVRYARTMTKAELEDLQGIPVRLLRDIVGFGRKHAIIRVKAGRMRNQWHHKGLAEYMTKQRFVDLGLTEAAIGVRDRTFGTQLFVEEEDTSQSKKKTTEEPKKKDVATPEESRILLDEVLPAVLVFKRKPIAPAEPATPRSPSLAAHAQISSQALPQKPDAAASAGGAAGAAGAADAAAIFGSVSSGDVLTRVREALLQGSTTAATTAAAAAPGVAVALENDSVRIVGLELGEDRIKRLGRWEVEIVPGRGVDPVRRIVEVVPEE